PAAFTIGLRICSSAWARIETWDGSKWNVGADWYQADEQILKPMVKAAGEKYAGEKKLSRRDASDCGA
ncbi:MAG: hypothetical protein J7549_15870, partial [Variovorax sp.]|nr:hypothetical protein [Variovorax sp.]